MSDMQKNAKAVNRRSFMQIAGLGAGAAGALALGAAVESDEAAADAAGAAKTSGYRETDHVRIYYQYLRF